MIIVSTTIIHALLPGQIFLPFCFFLSLLFFFLFLLILSIHLSFFSHFFVYVVVVVVTYIFLLYPIQSLLSRVQGCGSSKIFYLSRKMENGHNVLVERNFTCLIVQISLFLSVLKQFTL